MSTNLDDSAVAAEQDALPWPPPGLESMRGKIGPVARNITWGALWLTIPLLIGIATRQEFNTLGPYGRGWWFPLFTTSIATVMLAHGAIQFARLLRAGHAARKLGYDARTTAFVLTDDTGSTGLVLQGRRSYRHLQPKHREGLIFAHAGAQLLRMCAALWIPLGFVIALLMARTGLIGNAGMWVLTFAPPFLLWLLAGFAAGAEGSLRKQAERAAPDDARDALISEAAAWRSSQAVLRGVEPEPPARTSSIAAAFAPLAAIVLFAAAALPMVMLFPAFVMGPVASMRQEPAYEALQRQYESFGILAGIRPTPDSSITAEQAGVIFASLGGNSRSVHRQPAIDTVLGVNFDALIRSPLGQELSWPDSLIPKAAAGMLTPAQRSILDTLDFTRLTESLATLARAPGIDMYHARRNIVALDTVPLAFTGWWVIPTMYRVKPAATLAAVQAIAEGRRNDGETILHNLVGAGLRIMESGSSVGDFQTGRELVLTGARALANIMATTNRHEQAALFATVARTPGGWTDDEARNDDVEATLAATPRWVLDERNVRSLRWHRFTAMQTITSCLNYRVAVFPADASHQQWIADTRNTLVRFTSDSLLFERVRHGEWALPGKTDGRCRTPMPMREWVGVMF